MQYAQSRCAAKMVKLMIRAAGYEISATGGKLMRWGMGPRCASLGHESDPSQLRYQRPSCKAAEGSRTPRRFAAILRYRKSDRSWSAAAPCRFCIAAAALSRGGWNEY